MTSVRVVAVNTGVIADIGDGETRMRSAINKRPATGRIRVGRLGLDGDDYADKEFHGGPDQALYAYAREDLDWWTEQLGRELRGGTFGENITTAGVDISAAPIGQTWRVGTALVQVTSPRIPCNTFKTWLDEPRWVRRFAAAGRPGAYLRVLTEGDVAAGDDVEILGQPDRRVSVAEAMAAYYGHKDLMRALASVPELNPRWGEEVTRVLGGALA